MLDRRDVPLAPLTTLRLGGRADRLVTADDETGLIETVRAADAAGEPLLLLGGGSNLVLPDAGVPLAVRLVLQGLSLRQDGDRVTVIVAAGMDWEVFVALCVAEGLAGIEALSGVPGSVGASPVQNIGAYGQDVAQTITRVRAYDRRAGEIVTLTREQCGFDYRTSIFKRDPGHWLVLSVTFALTTGELSEPVRYAELARTLGVAIGARAPLREVREAVLALRRGKGMVLDAADPDTRSAGSFFTNPRLDASAAEQLRQRVRSALGPDVAAPEWVEPAGGAKVSAAWLIERAGFGKGAFDGPAGISSKHTLALVNRGGAKTADLLRVARTVRDGVHERFGVTLEHEPVIVGERL